MAIKSMVVNEMDWYARNNRTKRYNTDFALTCIFIFSLLAFLMFLKTWGERSADRGR